MTTIRRHILQNLISDEPLTIEELQTACKTNDIKFTLAALDLELDKLYRLGWVEYYELIKNNSELSFELCNRWYNLSESDREEILHSSA
jgi:hypothetical protein